MHPRKPRTRPTSPTASTSRHSLFVSPDKDNTDIPSKEDHYHHQLKASIEDALRSMLSEDMVLTKFVSEKGEGFNNPSHVFHCEIRAGLEVILDAYYPIFKFNNIENLASQFSEDLTKLKLDATEFATRIMRGLDNKNILIPDKNLGFGMAVYIIGADPLLGEWKIAHRLNYNETQKAWRFTLPQGVIETKYKYMTGPYNPSKTANPADLTWEEGMDRELNLSKTPTLKR